MRYHFSYCYTTKDSIGFGAVYYTVNGSLTQDTLEKVRADIKEDNPDMLKLPTLISWNEVHNISDECNEVRSIDEWISIFDNEEVDGLPQLDQLELKSMLIELKYYRDNAGVSNG